MARSLERVTHRGEGVEEGCESFQEPRYLNALSFRRGESLVGVRVGGAWLTPPAIRLPVYSS